MLTDDSGCHSVIGTKREYTIHPKENMVTYAFLAPIATAVALSGVQLAFLKQLANVLHLLVHPGAKIP